MDIPEDMSVAMEDAMEDAMEGAMEEPAHVASWSKP